MEPDQTRRVVSAIVIVINHTKERGTHAHVHVREFCTTPTPSPCHVSFRFVSSRYVMPCHATRRRRGARYLVPFTVATHTPTYPLETHRHDIQSGRRPTTDDRRADRYSINTSPSTYIYVHRTRYKYTFFPLCYSGGRGRGVA